MSEKIYKVSDVLISVGGEEIILADGDAIEIEIEGPKIDFAAINREISVKVREAAAIAQFHKMFMTEQYLLNIVNSLEAPPSFSNVIFKGIEGDGPV